MRHPESSAGDRTTPWSVDRWGRLISGVLMLLFTCLGWLLDPSWFLGDILVGANLVFTSLSGHCLLQTALIRCGAKQREDLFHPGGAPRLDAPSLTVPHDIFAHLE